MKRGGPGSDESPPPGARGALAEAEVAYAARAWSDAYLAFERAEAEGPLDDAELDRMSRAASLSGRDAEALMRMERLYERRVSSQQLPGAARMAFWIGLRLQGMREPAQAGAWFQRAQRLLADVREPCAEQGYLLASAVHRSLVAGDHEDAYARASEALAIGERFREPDLIALARQLQGRALLRAGQVERALEVFDEVMLATSRGEVSDTVTGVIYCGVISCFQQVFALNRAREWTHALAAWCDAQPQLVPFADTCLVHRAEILQLSGEWEQASEAALRCCERRHVLSPTDSVADAQYQRAEILRLRGELAAAEELYRLASERGREPQPGLALLRLAQGDIASAQSALRRVLATIGDPLRRAQYLPAFVEIALAAGAHDDAAQAAAELTALAAEVRTEVLGAIAARARGAVALAQGDAAAALEPLRTSFHVWQELQAPYLSARVRVLIGRACAALGDRDGEALELAAARKVFERLGATHDLSTLEAPPVSPSEAPGGPTPSAAPKLAVHGLTARELEVLRLVATGKTNKTIAASLFLSEKTVDRHVSNIFNKLDVRTRAAATAFAYAHGLVDQAR